MILEIVFAAGCFWGVEQNFERIDGVTQVVSGYAGGNYDNPTYDEVLKNNNLKSSGFINFLKNIGITNDDELTPEQGLINHTEVVKVSYNSNIVSTD